MSLTCTQLMRAPSPRSGLATNCRPGCSAVGTADATSNFTSKYRSRGPEVPSPCALFSPASLASSFENVWSLKLPLVIAFEMRKLCVPKAG